MVQFLLAPFYTRQEQIHNVCTVENKNNFKYEKISFRNPEKTDTVYKQMLKYSGKI